MIFHRIKQNRFFSKLIEAAIFLFFIPFRTWRLTQKAKNGKTILLSIHLLGDTVFTLPTVKYFMEKYGDDLSIVCYENSKVIYEKAGINAEFITLKNTDFFFGGRLPKKEIRRKIKKLKPFRIIDITGGIHSAFTIAGIGAAEVIGMNENIYKSLYDKFIPLRTTPHLIDKYFDVAKIFDENLDRENYSYLPEKINVGKRILFHPFGSWKEKEWGFEKFVELAKKLNGDGYETAFIWEEGRNEDENKALLKRENITLIETKSLEELFDELEKSLLLVSVDSGPVHIASLLGTSTAAIYGPTNPDFIKPEGENHLAIRKIIDCSPVKGKQYCDALAGRTCEHLKCLKNLTAEASYKMINDFLTKLNSK